MGKRSSLAKISRPEIGRILERDRLFRLLDSKQDYPVLWISGPPGSGKTTLISSYLAARNLHCLWYQIDERDADIAHFFYYMGLAAKEAAPRKKKPLPLLTPEYAMGIPTFARGFFEELFSRFAESVKRGYGETEKRRTGEMEIQGNGDTETRRGRSEASHFSASPVRPFTDSRFVIVLDNYQDVPANSGFHNMIIHGLDVIPSGVQVMILSRSEPPAEFARLRANNKVSFVEWDDLRLTLDESKAISRMKGEKQLAEEDLLSLHEKTDGWAAGLVLLLEQTIQKERGTKDPPMSRLRRAGEGRGEIQEKTGGESNRNFPGSSHEAVFDYLAGEIFIKADRSVQGFMLKTAFLPEIPVALAEKLTGNGQSGQILSNLSRNNLFTERLSSVEPAYRYHPLLRAFLLNRVRDVFAPEEIRTVKQGGARLLEESGGLEQAAELFIEAGVWTGIGGLIQRNAPSLLSQGRIKTLEGWLLRIPEEIMESSPWLIYWLGTCRTPVNTTEGRQFLERAFSLFKNEEDSAGAFLAWAGVVDSYVYEWSDFTPLDRWIGFVEELLDRHGGFPSVEIEARVASSMFSALIYRCPQHPRLVFWKERLNDLLLRTNDITQRVMMGANLVHYHLWVGDFAKAHSLIELLRPASSAQAIGPLVVLTWHFVESFYLQMTGNVEGSHKCVMKGLETAEVLGVHLLDFLLLSSGAYNALNAGDLAAASDFLLRMKSALNPSHRADVGHYHYLAGWEALLRNDLPHAAEHAQSALRLLTITGIPFGQALAHIAMAEVLISSKRFQEAKSHIAEAIPTGKGMNSLLLDFHCLLVEARLAMEQEDEPHCLEALRGAMELGKRQDFANHQWGLPSVMARLCAKALEAGIEVEHVQDLIRKRNLTPPIPPFDSISSPLNIRGDKGGLGIWLENWPWPLKIYALGRFEIEKDGKPVGFSGKVQRVPLLMLKALIALGAKDVKEEEVADLLWPEADGDLAHDSFRQTLSRLRQLLRIEKAIRFQEGKTTLDPRYCWVDLWAFERIHEQAERLWKDSPHLEPESNVFKLSEKAINLYRGHFLLGEAEHYWLLPLRGRLKRKFLNLISRLAHYYAETGEWKRAAEYYERGLEADNLAEELYQRLMVCYYNLGLRGEAIGVYQRCKEALSAIEGAEPSLKTQAIYTKIKQNP